MLVDPNRDWVSIRETLAGYHARYTYIPLLAVVCLGNCDRGLGYGSISGQLVGRWGCFSALIVERHRGSTSGAHRTR